MRIVKLKYIDKAEAMEDLIAKGIYQEIEGELTYGKGVHAIVDIGVIVNVQGTYDEEGNRLTDATFFEGYHYDLMIENSDIIFENEVVVANPKHLFSVDYNSIIEDNTVTEDI